MRFSTIVLTQCLLAAILYAALCLFSEFDIYIYISDFHREPAWGRWTNAIINGVCDTQDIVPQLLRNIAKANTMDEYDTAVLKLDSSQPWLKMQN